MLRKANWPAMATAFALLAPAVTPLIAQDTGPAAIDSVDVDGWPREIATTDYKIVIFQPQPETFEGNQVSYRAAVSVEETGKDSTAIYGAVWATARIETDRDERMAEVLDVDVTRVVFPDAEEDGKERLAALLEQELPKWGLEISLDRLVTSLEMAEMRLRSAEGLNMDPPEIVVTTTPSMLVTIEGDPNLQSIESTRFMQVVNTPFAMLFATDTRTFYLFAGENAWYTASEWRGPWQFTESVPSDVAAMAPDKPEDYEEAEDVAGEAQADEEEPAAPPEVVVATVPTELISIDGTPQWTPIDGTDLLFMSNTESDVFLDLDTSLYYVVLSGRWFSTAAADEPWVHVPSDQLPDSFSRIPFDSDAGHVLVWVASSDQAELAAIDANVPQTAAVIKSEATLEVEYDGEPQFEPIEETELEWAVNSAAQVIKYGDTYYVCDEAVWFVGNSAEGPWEVAESVPDEIYKIPADNPNHNVTYVYVYETKVDTVFVGYTTGYTGSYVHNTTIVYGTGWWWPGWWGTMWIARPLTWGFHVRWNPWFGWGFGIGWGWPRWGFGIGWGGWWRRGWWGPRAWRPVARGWGRGWNRGWNRGFRAGGRAGFRAGYRAGSRNGRANNMYRSQRNQARTRNQLGNQAGNRQRAGTAANRSNNVFADRNGGVHRQTDMGNWQQRDNRSNSWQGSGTRDRAGTGAASDRAQAGGANRAQAGAGNRAGGGASTSNLNRSQSQLNRSAQTRNSGTARTNNFNGSRSMSGGARGGGGGRRR